MAAVLLSCSTICATIRYPCLSFRNEVNDIVGARHIQGRIKGIVLTVTSTAGIARVVSTTSSMAGRLGRLALTR